MQLLNPFRQRALLAFALFSLSLAACKKDDATTVTPDPNTGTTAGQTVEVTEVKTSTTWTASNKYLLKGYVYVRSGATLTIEPGTIIKGDKDSKGALIVEPGAKLIAAGTAAKPIVFTSNQPKGSRNYGDWGGVILAGNAPVNSIVNGVKPVVEGGPTTTYGGTDAADNSGTLQYVRIEFGGIAFSPNNEVNGLTLCAVGSGTTLDHIQVSYSGDDSYEWFGGTVNAKYLIAHRGYDDDFDTDNGFSGKVQFAVSLRDPLQADQSGSKAFESDNDANASDNLPKTSAVFSNVTVIGPLNNINNVGGISSQYVAAAHIRRNSAQSIMNSVLLGYPAGLLLDHAKTAANVASNDLRFQNNILAGMAAGTSATRNQKNIVYLGPTGGAGSLTPTSTMSADTSAFGTAVGPLSWLYNSNNKNKRYTNADEVRLLNPFSLTAPSFLPLTTSPIVYTSTTNANPVVAPAFTDSKVSDSFFTRTSYIGAFSGSGQSSENWATGWTNFDPQNTDY
ncbi:T9SS C-terminal target domain-containing protein [Hymenobacter sp. M29]|uniref:T9SS C-terminal target domain-containing protein n=1 Tax=Hymenobacter mellowenesis TaxID=3063995 RepID=A0ABT9AGN9_9BACT|nr:T9SS C-terminal target domain-containing protein [Hymenobacter sp. M29]MDO7847852.1 T9SS C-terminal target domain-containing protein [Hymenobacter sp. M29]